MSRYIKDIQLDQPIDTVSVVMEDFTYHNQFRRADWNGEMVHMTKDRHGRERYLKWSYVSGRFHVEAWLKTRFGGEMDLDGVGGGASREEYRKCMDDLIKTLSQQDPNRIAAGHMGSDPIHHDNGHGDNHGTWSTDTKWQKEMYAGQKAGGEKPAGQISGGQNLGRQTPAGQVTGGQNLSRQNPVGQVTGGQNPTRRNLPEGGYSPEQARERLLAILSVFFGLIVPYIGIIFGALALREREDPSIRKIATAGIVIAIVNVFLQVVLTIGVGLFSSGFFNG